MASRVDATASLWCVLTRTRFPAVTYESHLEVTADGVHVEHTAWHTHVYEKHHDQWQQVWAQATSVGGFPPPGS